MNQHLLSWASICYFFAYLASSASSFHANFDSVHRNEYDVEKTDIKLVSLNPTVDELRQRPPTAANAVTKEAEVRNEPKTCADLKRGGAAYDGIYTIFPYGEYNQDVFCDMTTDGGGWTVLVRRGAFGLMETKFFASFETYEKGFGFKEGEYWLGNQLMSKMTTEEDNTLFIRLSQFDGSEVHLYYKSIVIKDAGSQYELNIGLPTESSLKYDDSITFNDYRPFSTFDKRGALKKNCPDLYEQGWWFDDRCNNCVCGGFIIWEYFTTNAKQEKSKALMFVTRNGYKSVKGVDVMIRPRNFTTGMTS